ncbi:MAG: hypothetical protein CVV44_06815 [Spirochaetae bacterium HGW-Spirochaetae-1]|jgi:hypothetical protein|nr:MAG: hypothetical protein CVV44_06815 [Spirochaetae bacterium HGW-Spirochaetae-1]
MNRPYRKLILLILFLPAFTAALYGGPLLSGRIVSVGDEGAFNTSNNPALLARQKDTNSLVFLGIYRPYKNFNDTMTLNYSSHDSMTTELSPGDSLFFNSFFGYSRNTKGFAWGLAVEGNQDGLYTSNKDTYSYAAQVAGLPYIEESTSSQWSASPTAVFSFAWLLDGRNALGLRFKTGYALEKIDEDKGASLNANVIEVSSRKNKTMNISGEAALGFTRLFPQGQLGLLVSTGRFIHQMSSLDYAFANPTNPVEDFTSSKNYKTHFIHDENISFTAGALTELTPALTIYMEGSLLTPVSKSIWKLKPDNTTGTIYIEKTSVSTDWIIAFKGGVEYTITPKVTMGAGAGYYNIPAYTVSGDSGDNNGNSNSHVLYLICGTQVTFSGIIAILGAQYSLFIHKTTFDASDYSIILEGDRHLLDIFAGVRVSF